MTIFGPGFQPDPCHLDIGPTPYRLELFELVFMRLPPPPEGVYTHEWIIQNFEAQQPRFAPSDLRPKKFNNGEPPVSRFIYEIAEINKPVICKPFSFQVKHRDVPMPTMVSTLVFDNLTRK